MTQAKIDVVVRFRHATSVTADAARSAVVEILKSVDPDVDPRVEPDEGERIQKLVIATPEQLVPLMVSQIKAAHEIEAHELLRPNPFVRATLVRNAKALVNSGG
jgi:hypothetical protein